MFEIRLQIKGITPILQPCCFRLSLELVSLFVNTTLVDLEGGDFLTATKTDLLLLLSWRWNSAAHFGYRGWTLQWLAINQVVGALRSVQASSISPLEGRGETLPWGQPRNSTFLDELSIWLAFVKTNLTRSSWSLPMFYNPCEISPSAAAGAMVSKSHPNWYLQGFCNLSCKTTMPFLSSVKNQSLKALLEVTVPVKAAQPVLQQKVLPESNDVRKGLQYYNFPLHT